MIDCGVMPWSSLYGALDGAAAIGLVDGLLHGVGDAVGVEDGAAFEMARGAAHGLDERAGRAQKAFLVGIENGDERNFRQVEAFAQQIDADERVVLALAQAGEQLHALQRFDLRVHVAAAHADLGVVAGEVFGHALGERGDEHALVAFGAVANLGEQIVDLAFDGADFDLGIDEAGGADDLLDDDAGGLGELVRAGRGGDVDGLVDAVLELLELERAVVARGGQAETVVDEVLLAALVAVPHAVHLRNGGVALVDEERGSRAGNSRAAWAAPRRAGGREKWRE